MEESEAKSQDFPSGEISTQPTATMTMDTKDLEDDVEELMSLFSTKHGYSICPESGRIIVNVPEGMAIVQNSRIKQYYDVDSPFRGKAGVRLSSILPFSNLIALVPDKETSVTYQIPDISEEAHAYKQAMIASTLWVRTTSVYIYDMVEKTIVYEKDFNCNIDYIKISNSFIAVSNADRVVIFDYKKKLNRTIKKNEILQRLISGYERRDYDNTVRYIEVEGVGSELGRLESSVSEPARLAFIKKQRQSLYVYDSQLNIFLDVPMNQDEVDFCMSPDGKYIALISEGGVNIRIVEIDTRETFTKFYRGSSLKNIAFKGFCDGWFTLASSANHDSTLHFFPLRPRKDASETIYSQYKRYFNTFGEPVDFFIKDNIVHVFSLVGCGFEVLDLVRARAKHAEDHNKLIKVAQVKCWTVDN